ncbi:MAG: peptidase T [Oscillospiraceae bacterium]|nr:peptidase T [Oscillospiraceae bacterium]
MSVLDKFLSYIKISSPSDEECENCPSSECQLNVAEFLKNQMTDMGLSDVRIEKGYVYGVLPATKGYEDVTSIGLIAHMDTAPEFSGWDVKPQLIENYDGGDVLLKGSGDVLSPNDFPELLGFKGHTLVTTDGTTLLGADDKAGIAVIMQAVEEIKTSGMPHGKICVGFTPDEEIGRGADNFDVEGFGAQFAYTVDGGLPGEIEYQNFNAYSATVTVTGRSIHPGSSKNQMINSQRVAFEFDSMLPAFEKPEYTEGFEGFFHLIGTDGCTEKTVLHYILRDHDDDKIVQKANLMHEIAAFINKKYGKELVHVETKESYRNMKCQILPHFHLIENAKKAVEMAGMVPEDVAISAALIFVAIPPVPSSEPFPPASAIISCVISVTFEMRVAFLSL